MITVTDIIGRVVEKRSGIEANSSIQFGNNYSMGVYFVEVSQGGQKVKLKLIKL
jgi:hypothetical protein